MEEMGKSVRKPFTKSIKVETADLASAPSVILDLGSPSIESTSSFSQSLAAATYTNAVQVTGDAVAAGTITIPANVDTIAELLTALNDVDGGTDFVSTFTKGDTVKGINSYITIAGGAALNATSTTGSNLGAMTQLDALASDILAKWGYAAYKRNATNGVWHQLSMLVSNEASRASTKGSITLSLGSHTLTSASTFPVSQATTTSNLVVKGEVAGTFAIATGTITGGATTIANVVTAMDATSGVTVTFVPGAVGTSAKIKIELDTAGENTSIDASNFLAAGEIVAILAAALSTSSTGVTVDTPVLGTSAFDKFNFLFDVRNTSGEPVPGFTGVFNRNTGKVTIADGSTGVLAAGQLVTVSGSFSK